MPLIFPLEKYSKMVNACMEVPELRLGDDSTKIFLCSEGNGNNVSEELKDFLGFISGKPARSKLTKQIESEVEKARTHDEWRQDYMTLLMRDREKIEEGRQEGRQLEIYSLVQDGFLTKELAAKRLDMSVAELEKQMKEAGYTLSE